MKKILRIIGVLLVILGIVSFLMAGLWYFGSTHTLDGSAQLYYNQRRYMMFALIIGVVCEIGGALCLVKR